MNNSATKETSIETRKHNLKVLWLLSDKWFRFLEFILILSTLYYFKDKTQNIFVGVIYWLSWAIFYMWVLEVGEFLADKINDSKKSSNSKKYLIWMFSMFVVISIYSILIGAMNSIMLAK